MRSGEPTDRTIKAQQHLATRLPPCWVVTHIHEQTRDIVADYTGKAVPYWWVGIADPFRNTTEIKQKVTSNAEVEALLAEAVAFADRHNTAWVTLRRVIKDAIKREWIDAYTPSGDRISPPTFWGRTLRCCLAEHGRSSLWFAAYMPSGYREKTSPQHALRLFVFFRHATSHPEADKCITLAFVDLNPYSTDGLLDVSVLRACMSEMVAASFARFDVMRAETAALVLPDVTDLIDG